MLYKSFKCLIIASNLLKRRTLQLIETVLSLFLGIYFLALKPVGRIVAERAYTLLYTRKWIDSYAA